MSNIVSILILLMAFGCWPALASSPEPPPTSIALVEKGNVIFSSVSLSLDNADVFPAQTPETLLIKVADNEPIINAIRSLDALAKSGTVEFIFVNSDGEPYNWPHFFVPTSDNYLSHPWMKFLNEVLSCKSRTTTHGSFRFTKIGVGNHKWSTHKGVGKEQAVKNIFILSPAADATWDSVVRCLNELHPMGIHGFVFVRELPKNEVSEVPVLP